MQLVNVQYVNDVSTGEVKGKKQMGARLILCLQDGGLCTHMWRQDLLSSQCSALGMNSCKPPA